MDWFSSWFNTPFYHILYKNRDENEAVNFLKHLTKELDLTFGSKVMDLACGKGRHSLVLNKLGYHVLGVDLSKESILKASEDKNENLDFQVADMRNLDYANEFDAVLNLFTSIGYFNDLEDNQKVFNSVFQSLKSKGVFVVDFFNTNYVLKNLIPHEIKEIDGIKFVINKKVENGIIIKDISFTYQGKLYTYQEKVQALTLKDFSSMLNKASFEVVNTFGDYELNSFNELESKRLIIMAIKK